MGRKKKNPDYNAEQIAKEYIDAVTEFYYSKTSSGQNQSIRAVADEFDTTILKIRKILITSGVYQSERSEQVQTLRAAGRTIEEIQNELGISRASVYSYLPYIKTIYNAKEISANAQRLQTYRKRKRAVSEFVNALEENRLTESIIWDTVSAFAGYLFYTSKGIKFYYSVQGGEIRVDRKKKTITKSSVFLFVQLARKMECEGNHVSGPKQLGTFGASYLYAMFIRFGLIEDKNIH